MLPRIFGGAIVLLLVTVLGDIPAVRAGELMLTPTRVVFEGRERSSQVHVVNTSPRPATFRISLFNQRMTRDGTFEPITTSTSPTGEKFADELIRYSPRVVRLPPGGSQIVRLQLRKPAELSSGEYRSHLVFQTVDPEAGSSINAVDAEGEPRLTARLIPIYGISIPVIVRHGQTSTRAGLSNLELVSLGGGEEPGLSFLLTREGNQSTYGNIEVTFRPRGALQDVTLATRRGLAVYTPNTERVVRIPLTLPSDVRLADGRLRVVYRDAGGRSRVLAEGSLDL